MAGTAFNSANWDGYDEQSVTNPGSALTDFTLLIDISTLSADWKAAVQSDGGDIRCTKGDDTEIPLDVINWAYNAGAPTGWIRTSWDGTLASAGTQKVRVWAGHGTAVAYDANETYGQYNAYPSTWEAYYPLHDLNDRTSNQNTLTNDGATADAVGQVGDCYEFDDADHEYLYDSDCDGLPSAAPMSILAWVRLDDLSVRQRLVDVCASTASMYGWDLWFLETTNVAYFTTYNDGGGTASAVTTSALSINTWHHIAAIETASDARAILLDAGNKGTDTTDITAASPDAIVIGHKPGGGNDTSGRIDDVQVHSAALSDDWIAEEYAQSNDQPAFWGVWAWTAASGTIARQVISAYRRTR